MQTKQNTKNNKLIQQNTIYIKKTADILKQATNTNICNYNKKHKTRLEFTTDKEIINKINNNKEIMQAFKIIGEIAIELFKDQQQEYYKNKAYQDKTHPAEQSNLDIKIKQDKQNKHQEFINHKTQDIKTIKAANKAMQEPKEEE